ncbi:hypothetical protein [Candidatus Contubernalis alkaliaceticus]|nr:hypothetical protein [Candidatus Contubernalis alkalaceticus]
MFLSMDKKRNKNWSVLIALPLAAFLLGKMVGDMMNKDMLHKRG